jgi:hypothetical protein
LGTWRRWKRRAAHKIGLGAISTQRNKYQEAPNVERAEASTISHEASANTSPRLNMVRCVGGAAMYSTTGLLDSSTLCRKSTSSQLGVPAQPGPLAGVVQFQRCRKIKGSSNLSAWVFPAHNFNIGGLDSLESAGPSLLYVQFSHPRVNLSQ